MNPTAPQPTATYGTAVPGEGPSPLPSTPKITALQVEPPFSVVATFETGERRRLDLADGVGAGPIAPPADPAAFARVEVEPGGFALAWPGGADLHRDSIYYGGSPLAESA